jgi:hypothetical protein
METKQPAEVTVRKKSLFKETQPPMSKYDITLERCVTLSHHFWAVCVWIFAPAFVWCHLSFNERRCVLPPERPKSYGHAECCRALRKMKTAACAMGHLLYTHRHATRCIIYIWYTICSKLRGADFGVRAASRSVCCANFEILSLRRAHLTPRRKWNRLRKETLCFIIWQFARRNDAFYATA